MTTFILFRAMMYLITGITIGYLRIVKRKIVDLTKEVIFLCLISAGVAFAKLFDLGVDIMLMILALIYPYMALKYILVTGYYIKK